MKCAHVSELEGILHMLCEHRIEELRFAMAPYELRMCLNRYPTGPHTKKPRRREEGEADTSEPYREEPSSEMPRKKSCLLLRSPGVGIWSPPADSEDRTADEKPMSAGVISTLLGDEEQLVPCRGKASIWLVTDGEAVGYGTPVALWEVD